MNPDLLKLVQWLSPAFPTGAYAYSHGLEAAISDGLVFDSNSLEAWIDALLRHGSGWQDAVLVARALDPNVDYLALSDYAAAIANCAERWQETFELGAAFAVGVKAVGVDVFPYALPVAVGAAASRLDIQAPQIVALYLHSFVANLVSAAVRFVPLGQSDGQRVLNRLHVTMTDIAARAVLADLEGATSGALGSDMAAMRHETMDVRIFRT